MKKSGSSTLFKFAFLIVPLLIAGQATGNQSTEPANHDAPARVQIQESEVEGIYNFSRIPGSTGFGGATEPSAMQALQQQGFTTVISLRTDGEMGYDREAAQAAAEAAGLKYVHLPFNPGDPAPGIVDEFLATVDAQGNQPAYVHCGSATRVGALWMVKRVQIDGATAEAAQAEVEVIAGKPEFAIDLAESYLEEEQDSGPDG